MKILSNILLLLLLLLLQISSICIAQNQGNVWYFGTQVGIDFNNCEPTGLTNSQMPPSEGCATISDTMGQLLFYTNSDYVWDRTHNIMPNGNLIWSNGTLSQVIIVPKPSSQNFFYIITTQIQGQNSFKSQYHIVDMSLNGGLGDISSKNNVLDTATITEQVAATFHSNGTDIWIIVHEYGNNKFLCYLLTSSGLNTSPVISNVSSSIIPSSSGMNARGEIKFSPNGKKVAMNNNGTGNDPNSDYLCLFDFDNSNGIVSNPINLPYERGGFGVSFSPDNSKLYAATWKAFNFNSTDSNKLYQFDISSNDSLTIANTKTILYSVPLNNGKPFGSLELAHDGKIYVVHGDSNYLGVINSPNQSGVLCNYIKNGLYLEGKIATIGLNNHILYNAYCNSSGMNQIELSSSAILFQNSPNPFGNETTINYFLPENIKTAKMVFYDNMGRVIKEVVLEQKGNASVVVNTEKLASGIYSYNIVVDDKVIDTLKMQRVK